MTSLKQPPKSEPPGQLDSGKIPSVRLMPTKTKRNRLRSCVLISFNSSANYRIKTFTCLITALSGTRSLPKISSSWAAMFSHVVFTRSTAGGNMIFRGGGAKHFRAYSTPCKVKTIFLSIFFAQFQKTSYYKILLLFPPLGARIVLKVW